jgi:hypothetical protein
MMGEVSQTLTGTPTAYQPGHWFNSAKFLLNTKTTDGFGLKPKKVRNSSTGNITPVKKRSVFHLKKTALF